MPRTMIVVMALSAVNVAGLAANLYLAAEARPQVIIADEPPVAPTPASTRTQARPEQAPMSAARVASAVREPARRQAQEQLSCLPQASPRPQQVAAVSDQATPIEVLSAALWHEANVLALQQDAALVSAIRSGYEAVDGWKQEARAVLLEQLATVESQPTEAIELLELVDELGYDHNGLPPETVEASLHAGLQLSAEEHAEILYHLRDSLAVEHLPQLEPLLYDEDENLVLEVFLGIGAIAGEYGLVPEIEEKLTAFIDHTSEPWLAEEAEALLERYRHDDDSPVLADSADYSR